MKISDGNGWLNVLTRLNIFGLELGLMLLDKLPYYEHWPYSPFLKKHAFLI